MATVRTRAGNRDSQIFDYFRQYTGSAPETHGWGSDIDDRYLESIRQSIYGSEAAQNYRNRPAQPEATADSTPTPAQSNGQVFTDPGAQRWESSVNSAASRLQQPQPNPDFQPYVDYMRKYFAQLQQPGYTPAQQDLMQTQALDPLERQRTAAKQQVTQRFAGQGVQGGLVERALQDVDRQFNEMRTKSQSGFAINQIGQDQARQQQAAQVGSALSQAQQAAATNDEGRMMQALSLLFQIPQYADTRMMNANQVLQPLNPTSLLNSLGSINASNQGQNNQTRQQDLFFWSQLGQLLAQSFGG